ncbi:hypothetical protein C8J57DRAFT_1493840 [Mycena rebaudengoi]|nr:hypothetical protein C8J57DRAFT_1493840 [Mycena rebaudengoi]
MSGVHIQYGTEPSSEAASAPPGYNQFVHSSSDLPASSPPKSTRARHSRKQPDGHIPRPPNAFILFRSSFIRSQRVSSEVETNHSTLSKIIGMTWQNLPEAERRVWREKARLAVEEHKHKFPAYAFRPVARRERAVASGAGKKRRKTRETGVDDPARCEKIAELLVEGKQGSELNAAVRDFDRDRSLDIVARFEPPITAMTYQRSSSEPVPDTAPSTGFLHSSPTSSSSRRSSSEEPPQLTAEEHSAPAADKALTAESIAETFDSSISPWTLQPESDYFDFNEFSFSAPAPPSTGFICDTYESTTGSLQLGFPPTQDIGSLIADDWHKLQPQDANTGAYCAPNSVPCVEGIACYSQPSGYLDFEHPSSGQAPMNDADLAELMLQYSIYI